MTFFLNLPETECSRHQGLGSMDINAHDEQEPDVRLVGLHPLQVGAWDTIGNNK